MLPPDHLRVNGLDGQQSDPIRVSFFAFELQNPKNGLEIKNIKQKNIFSYKHSSYTPKLKKI